MLGIRINTEFLDLAAGSNMEIEQENPFLQFNDQLNGTFSLPFQVKASPKNLRLLNYAGMIQKKQDIKGIDAFVYDNQLQHSGGKIKIENIAANLNFRNSGNISCYYLTGSSNFLQDIKDQRLRDIDVGGDRSFAWGGYVLSGASFWGHINTVLNSTIGNYDYAFYPVVNQLWPLLRTEVMNFVEYSGGNVQFTEMTTDGRDANVIVPFPYLKYVIKKLFANFGWTLQGDLLNDPDFKKITMVNFLAINWAGRRKTGPAYFPLPNATVVFNLADHLPDISVAEFLVAIKNRFGLWYDFDSRNKIATIRMLRDLVAGEIKDFTTYANPAVLKKIVQDKKIYALRNQFNSSLGDGKPSFESIFLQGSVNTVADLPTAAEGLYGYAYLVIAENNYYICRQNEGTDEWEWVFYTYNIYDYEPADSTDDINTSATTIGVEKYNSYLDLVPRIDSNGIWPGRSEDDADWNINLLFFHGIKNNKLGDPYPYASSHIYDSNGNQVADWALSFECKDFDRNEVGLYEKNWKDVLNLLQGSEEFEITVNLPLEKFKNLLFSDRLLINGVMMFITTIKNTIPYNKSVLLECIRI